MIIGSQSIGTTRVARLYSQELITLSIVSEKILTAHPLSKYIC